MWWVHAARLLVGGWVGGGTPQRGGIEGGVSGGGLDGLK